MVAQHQIAIRFMCFGPDYWEGGRLATGDCAEV